MSDRDIVYMFVKLLPRGKVAIRNLRNWYCVMLQMCG